MFKDRLLTLPPIMTTTLANINAIVESINK